MISIEEMTAIVVSVVAMIDPTINATAHGDKFTFTAPATGQTFEFTGKVL